MQTRVESFIYEMPMSADSDHFCHQGRPFINTGSALSHQSIEVCSDTIVEPQGNKLPCGACFLTCFECMSWHAKDLTKRH